VVGEELEGDYFENGEEELGGTGDVDDVVYQLGDMGIALHCQRDDADGDLLDVREGLLVLEDGGGVGGVLGGEQTTGSVSSMRALGLCFIAPAG